MSNALHNYSLPNVSVVDFQEQQKAMLARAEEVAVFQFRARAMELVISAGGNSARNDKLIADAEAIYQWLRNGPAKTDGE